mmetsp:Transcript_28730/g.37695  ORF Transcript_28730/g.37695 Transcript_28730/m.37695 type:complete len:378 (+) Transcript_28730:320-1453(+)|eukprot:CAMPEP_0117841422 /NCGR_PEP_ID=MMETSP0949-20121206/15294_1 /TAXON_ID=44440 /ORGANISM="Chattonella subsalsa, Strain CCMP2191" /LENGTH=377 /DNA_ID=CAMNT_0005685045 /DNA_START=141 /DNA_END=1274 /DNA_ORIENTATION=+
MEGRNSPSDISMDFFSGNSASSSQNDFLKAAMSGNAGKQKQKKKSSKERSAAATLTHANLIQTESSLGKGTSSSEDFAEGTVNDSPSKSSMVVLPPSTNERLISALSLGTSSEELEPIPPDLPTDEVASELSLASARIVDTPESKNPRRVAQRMTRDVAKDAVYRQTGLRQRLQNAESGLREMRRRWQESQHQEIQAQGTKDLLFPPKPPQVGSTLNANTGPEDDHPPAPRDRNQERQKSLLRLAALGQPESGECFDKPRWENGFTGLKVGGLASKEVTQVDLFGSPLPQTTAEAAGGGLKMETASQRSASAPRSRTNKSIFRSPSTSRRPAQEQRNKWDPGKKKWIKPNGQQANKEKFMYSNEVLLRKQLNSFYNM